jgi:hypothetical protein
MKVFRLTLSLALVGLLFTQCLKKDFPHGGDHLPAKMYTVTVENVSTNYMFFESGVSSIPEGASVAGPAHPGESFKFSFHAGPNHKLSFATMYGFSNDGFYAPDGMGIDLYNSGSPVTGDITSQVMLWDAGTQMNQMPGMANMHDGADENGVVQLMSAVGDGYDYGMVSTNLKVTLDYDGNSMFTVTIDNLATTTTGISPVAWVVHSAENPLFEAGMADYDKGLEDLAETGNASVLGDYLSMNSGYVSPIAPVLWVIHDKDDRPVFTENDPDYGWGLELLAETGDPSELNTSLMDNGYTSGVYNMPDIAGGAGPIFPGDKYTFTIEAKPNKYLSIASMLGNSNDEFFAFGDDGFKLTVGNAVKDITSEVMIWDAGTEPNEYPGAKTSNEDVEGGTVRMLDDGFPWPEASQVIKVTIQKN